MEQVIEKKELWLNARSKGIGGSEVAAVLDLDPYRSRYKVWLEKISGKSEPIENAYTVSGNRLEKVVVEYFVGETKFVIEPQEEGVFHHITHPDYPYMVGSRDRIYIKPTGERCVLECKTTQTNIDKENLPMTWFCQVQWYMGLYGLKTGAIAWLERGIRFDFVEVSFDEGFFQYLVTNVKEFWENYVLTKTEPPISTAEDVATKFPKHRDGVMVTATDELFDEYNKLKGVREKIKELEAQEEEIINRFKVIMRDAEIVSYHGMTLATWKSSKDSMSFDYKSFQEQNPELVQPYMKLKAGVRKFLVK